MAKIDSNYDNRLAAVGAAEIRRAEAEKADQQQYFEICALRHRGRSRLEIAQVLGIEPERVDYQLTRARILRGHEQAVKKSDEIERQKQRLARTLPGTAAVFRHAIANHQTDARHLKIAVDASIALNRGLGVLVDKVEAEPAAGVNIFAQLRDNATLHVELLRSFGIQPGTNSLQIEPKQGAIDIDNIDR